MSIFLCPFSIVDESGNAVWSQKSPNTSLSCHVCLQMGKECDATLQSLTVFNDDILKLLNEGFNVTKQDVSRSRWCLL